MEIWTLIWMAVFALGFLGFSYISYRVIARGFGEMKDLLDQIRKDPP